jgi:hypothetical protein
MTRTINLYWSGGRKNGINYGDSLSPVIVELLSGKRVQYAPIHKCDLVSIGSILEKCSKSPWKRQLFGRRAPLIIWGTGSMFRDSEISAFSMQIYSVRGNLTLSKLGLPKDMATGDPGILVDMLLDGKPPAKRFRWGIIPHFSDCGDQRIHSLHERTRRSTIINVKDPDLRETTRRIAECEYVASSSLHGLIAADSLGIPNLRLTVTGKVTGGDWKFDDYATSVGNREVTKVQLSDAVDLDSFEKRIAFNYAAAVPALKQQALNTFQRLSL